MKSTIEQIKNIIKPSTIVSRKVGLKLRGLEHTGLCPFHNEKSPSFTVSDEKGFYHCFGCGAHGDIFTFVMKTQNLEYYEALTQLANEAGVILPKKGGNDFITDRKIEVCFQIYEVATTYFANKLTSFEGKPALDYLTKRGINAEIIQQFRLGFAPHSHNELLQLLQKNFSREEILNSKILQQNENKEFYNLLRNRIIFPIFNIKGKVISFGGRIINTGEPKYLNSTENPIFNKGSELYGLNFVRQHLKDNTLILVEGYIDVIALFKNGFKTAVAPLGTAVKETQIELLWKFCNEPLICMDADNAGKNSMVRLAYNALPNVSSTKSLRFIRLQGGKDPDEVIKNHGVNYFTRLKDSASSLADFLFEHEKNLKPLQTPEQTLDLKNRLIDVSKKIKLSDLQKNYQFYLLGEYYKLFKNDKKKPVVKADATKEAILNYELADNDSVICSILMLILENNELINYNQILSQLGKLEIKDIGLDTLRNKIIDLTENGLSSSSAFLDLKVDFLSTSKYNRIYMTHEACNDVEIASTYIDRLFKIISLKDINEQLEYLMEQLNISPSDELFQKFINLKNYEENLKTQLGIV